MEEEIRRALCPERVRSKLFDVSCVMLYNVQPARPLNLLNSFFEWCALGAAADANPLLEGSLVGPWWVPGGSLVGPWWVPGGSLVGPWCILGASLVHPWRLLAPLDLVPRVVLDPLHRQNFSFEGNFFATWVSLGRTWLSLQQI